MFQGIRGTTPLSFILIGGGEERVWHFMCFHLCGENRGIGGERLVEGFHVSFTSVLYV